jgi:methionine-rich copper-binding protein CopC
MHPAKFVVSALALTTYLGLGLNTAMAQHQGHGGPQFGVSAAAAGIIAESQPADDAILGSAPDTLQLSFEQPVRLVKLVLYNELHDWVDIGFRYRPRLQTAYSWPVPPLQQAAYYRAEWAILDDGDRLVKGSFAFSFGPGAESPSVIMEREMHREMGHMMHEMEAMEPMQPGEIITNDQPDPPFEPPFAPVLRQPPRQ